MVAKTQHLYSRAAFIGTEMTLDQDIRKGRLSRRQFLQVLGLAGAGAAVAGLPVAAKAAQRTERFVGTPGETYMIPTVETVQGFIDAETVTDVIGDLASKVYKINHKNLGQINEIKAQVIGRVPTLVLIASESNDASTAGFFKTMALSFPEMGLLYADCDVNEKYHQDMGDILSFHHFKNEATPAIVFYDKAGKRVKALTGLFKTKDKFYEKIDKYFPFIAERVLGGKYADRAFGQIPVADYYAIGTPVDPKLGYPEGTRWMPFFSRGIKGEATKVQNQSHHYTQFKPGEFPGYFLGDYHKAIMDILKASKFEDTRKAFEANKFDKFMQETDRNGRTFIFGDGYLSHNNGPEKRKYVMKVPTNVAPDILAL